MVSVRTLSRVCRFASVFSDVSVRVFLVVASPSSWFWTEGEERPFCSGLSRAKPKEWTSRGNPICQIPDDEAHMTKDAARIVLLAGIASALSSLAKAGKD